MTYTVKKLSQLSGVSVRTLHHYDAIGLLKPAYIGANGYRFYEEEQVLMLQQILFFRELKIGLKQIQKILGQSDFDQKAALASHRKILLKEKTRLQELVDTIDKTIKHYEGEKTMATEDIFSGFLAPDKLERFEQSMAERFEQPFLSESKEKSEAMTQDDWIQYFQENNELNKALAHAIEKKRTPDSKEVQELIQKHYDMMQRFSTPTKQAYLETAKLYVESQTCRESYAKWHPELASFLAEGMKVFAEKNF